MTALAGTVSAQMFSYEPNREAPVSSLTVGTHLVNFTHRGAMAPKLRFDFGQPVLSIMFTRPSLEVSAMLGKVNSDADPAPDRMSVAEAALFAWGGIPIAFRPNLRVFIPLLLHSGYRVVGEELTVQSLDDQFAFTSLGLGTGIGLESRLTTSTQLTFRATPIIGMSLRSVEGYAGTTTLFDATATVHATRLFGRLGLTGSAGFRWQRWNIDNESFATGRVEDAFDYQSVMTMLRLGVNW